VVHKKLNYGRKVYLKCFIRKISSEDSFTFKGLNRVFMKNNSLVIIYRFGSHSILKNSINAFIYMYITFFTSIKKQKNITYGKTFVW
jgi:hypothetical protein